MTTTMNAYLDHFRFLRSWATDPLRVASIAPSSSALSRLITSEVDPEHGPVIELGPGTGVFTRQLLARGVPEANLTLVEFGSDFARDLDFRFQKARVLWMDASQIARDDLFPDQTVGTVISGLPLLSMSPRKVMRVVSGSFRYLRPGGCFYQFTYGPRCPVPRPILDRLGLKAHRIGGTLQNIPPASVYRIGRRRSLDVAAR